MTYCAILHVLDDFWPCLAMSVWGLHLSTHLNPVHEGSALDLFQTSSHDSVLLPIKFQHVSCREHPRPQQHWNHQSFFPGKCSQPSYTACQGATTNTQYTMWNPVASRDLGVQPQRPCQHVLFTISFPAQLKYKPHTSLFSVSNFFTIQPQIYYLCKETQVQLHLQNRYSLRFPFYS